MPSVSLEMHEQTMNGMRETEDVNAHHLLQQHLYKGRKQVSKGGPNCLLSFSATFMTRFLL